MVLSVSRKAKPSEKFLRMVMIVCAVLFLLLGIMFSTGFMLPCFLMAATYFIYKTASKKEWEYTLDEDRLLIERVSNAGREPLHEISLREIEVLSQPDDPAVAQYRKGGGTKIPKYDYTSYREGVPYYTMIAWEDGKKIKLLLDLSPEAIRQIRMYNRSAVRISG